MRVDNLIKWLEQFPDNYQVFTSEYEDGLRIEVCEEKDGRLIVEKVKDIDSEI